MKKTVLSVIIISSATLMACSGIDSPEKDTSIMPDSPRTLAPAIVSSTADSTKQIIAAPTTGAKPNNQPQPAAPATNVAGLNPAHGQPGHRCDIAVGAPLNSPVANTSGANGSKPQIQKMNAPVAVPAGSIKTNGTARLNPEHGQPGHDCSVQVGAPLKN
jgi:hypothetical protein